MSSAMCEQVRSELSAYLDGELGGEPWQQVDSHLRDCPACAAELAALRDVSRELASLPRSAVPRDLAGAVRREFVRDALTPAARPAGRAGAWLTAIRVSASAALIVLAVTVTWRVARPASDHSAAPALVSDLAGPEVSPTSELRQNAAEPDDFASKSEQARGFASGIELRTSRSDESVVALGLPSVKDRFVGGSVVDAGRPIVNLVVAPQTEAAYKQTIEILRSAAESYASFDEGQRGAAPGRLGFAGLEHDNFQNTAGRAGERVIDLTVGVEQLWELIDALEENASQQVSVAMNFRGSDSRLLQASLAGRADRAVDDVFFDENESSPVDVAAPVVANAETDKRSAGRAVVDREEVERAPAGEAGQGGGEVRRKMAATPQRSSSEKRPGAGGEAPRGLKDETRTARRPSSVTSGRGRSAAVTGGRVQSPPANREGALNAPTKQRRAGLGQPAEKIAAADFKKSQAGRDANGNGWLSKRGAIAEKQAGGSGVQRPVRFRVRVAAPPVEATTRPTSSAPSRP